MTEVGNLLSTLMKSGKTGKASAASTLAKAGILEAKVVKMLTSSKAELLIQGRTIKAELGESVQLKQGDLIQLQSDEKGGLNIRKVRPGPSQGETQVQGGTGRPDTAKTAETAKPPLLSKASVKPSTPTTTTLSSPLTPASTNASTPTTQISSLRETLDFFIKQSNSPFDGFSKLTQTLASVKHLTPEQPSASTQTQAQSPIIQPNPQLKKQLFNVQTLTEQQTSTSNSTAMSSGGHVPSGGGSSALNAFQHLFEQLALKSDRADLLFFPRLLNKGGMLLEKKIARLLQENNPTEKSQGEVTSVTKKQAALFQPQVSQSQASQPQISTKGNEHAESKSPGKSTLLTDHGHVMEKVTEKGEKSVPVDIDTPVKSNTRAESDFSTVAHARISKEGRNQLLSESQNVLKNGGRKASSTSTSSNSDQAMTSIPSKSSVAPEIKTPSTATALDASTPPPNDELASFKGAGNTAAPSSESFFENTSPFSLFEKGIAVDLKEDLKSLAIQLLTADQDLGSDVDLEKLKGFVQTFEKVQLLNSHLSDSGKYLIPFPIFSNGQFSFGQIYFDLGEKASEKNSKSNRILNVSLFLSMSELGPVRADFSVFENYISGVFQVADPEVAALFNHSLQELTQNLQNHDYRVRSISCKWVPSNTLSEYSILNDLIQEESSQSDGFNVVI